GVIRAHVLPEIRQLQRSAGVVGKLLAPGIVITAQVKDKMSDGIRRITAVSEDIVEAFETRDGLILPERDQQIGELVLGDFEFPHRLGQRHKNRMPRTPFVAGLEFHLPFVEKSKRCARVSHFVSQIIGDTAIGVNVEKILAKFLGQKPGGYREIFVVRASELAAIFLRFFERRRDPRNRVRCGQTAPTAYLSGADVGRNRRSLRGNLGQMLIPSAAKAAYSKKP